MAFEDLSRVIVVQGCCRGVGNFEKEIHANGKIRRLQKSGVVFFDQLPDAADLSMPAGRADHHILTCPDARFDVGEHVVRSREIDDRVDAAQLLRRERGARGVFRRAGNLDVMLAFGGDFRDD